MAATDQHDTNQLRMAWDEWRAAMVRARHSRQLTIADVATMIRVSRQSISNWENGVNRPNIVNARRWAAAFDRAVPATVQTLLRTRDSWQSGADAVCGTDAAYIRHQRLKETPCEPCRTAHREYQRVWRARRRAKPAEQQETA